MTTLINQLNALAKRTPRAAFMAAGALNRVTYVIVYDGEVLYAGEGYSQRATLRLKVQGLNDPDFDYVISQYYGDPLLEIYYAASKITKAVAVEFEGILMDEFKPPFNTKPKSSIWATLPTDNDTFSKMLPAEKLDYKFGVEPPRLSHIALHKQCATKIPGQRELEWDDFQPEEIITRRSLRQKNNEVPHEQAHYNCYPKELGATTTIAEHRARCAQAHAKLKSWNRVKSILHWDRLYSDAEGPIITVTPPDTTK